MTLRRLSIVMCVLGLGAAPALADPASDAMDRAKSAYVSGDYGKSYQDLQVAMAQVGRKLLAIYDRTFPDPPSSWEAQKARSQAQNPFVQGFILSRRYRESGDGKARITAQLIVDSPLLTAMAGIFNNPSMALSQNYERVELNGVGAPVWVKYDKASGRGEAIVFMASRVFIKMTGTNLPDKSALVNFLGAWDFATLKKTAGVN